MAHESAHTPPKNGISAKEFFGLLAAIEIIGSTAGYLGSGGFCFACWGQGKLLINFPAALTGSAPSECPVCGGDGSLFA